MVIKEEEEHLNYLDVQKTFKFWRRKEKKGKKRKESIGNRVFINSQTFLFLSLS